VTASGASQGKAIVVDLSGVYVGGWFAGIAKPSASPAITDSGAGVFSLRSAGETSGFVVQLAFGGNFVSALSFGGTGQAAVLGLSTLKLGGASTGSGNFEVVGRADWSQGFVPSQVVRANMSPSAGDTPM